MSIMIRDQIIAAREAGRVNVRAETVSLRLRFDSLVAADGHLIDVSARLRVRPGETRADQQLIAEELLGSQSQASVDDLRRRLIEACMAGVRGWASAIDGAAAIEPDSLAACSSSLDADLRRACFAIGFEMLGPATCEIHSPTLERERRRARIVDAPKKTLAETIAANATPPRVLVVAGNKVSSIEPGANLSIGSKLDLSDLTALRSVSRASYDGKAVLLVGGRRGVSMIDAATLGVIRTYLLGDSVTESGVNAACILAADGVLLGTHSVHGLVAWDTDSDAPARVIRKTPARFVRAIDSRRAVFVANGALHVVDADGVMRCVLSDAADVVEIALADDRLVIVRRSGAVQRLDGITLDVIDRRMLASPIEAASVIDSRTLIVSSELGRASVQAIETGEMISFSGATGIGQVAFGGGLVAALTIDRRRLFIWDSKTPSAPMNSIDVTAVLGARAADVLVETI